MNFNPAKFCWTEIFSNNNGKTSSTKSIGILSSIVCILLFVVMVIFYMFNLPESGVILAFVDKIITFFGISAGLMGIKSITSAVGGNNVSIENKVQSDNSSQQKEG